MLVAALGHGIAAGSDTGRTGMQVFYVILASLVGALVALRAVVAVGAPRAVDS